MDNADPGDGVGPPFMPAAKPSGGRTDEREALADERDHLSDVREVFAEARDEALTDREHRVVELLDAALDRDQQADRRDAAAEQRDAQAAPVTVETDEDEAAVDARSAARIDRRGSKSDRIASSEDRSELSAPVGAEPRLPACIEVEQGVFRPLEGCTTDQLKVHAAALLDQSLRETEGAIEMVEHDGIASPAVKALLRQAKEHHEQAGDVVLYINEWIATGVRSQVQLVGVDQARSPSAHVSFRTRLGRALSRAKDGFS